MVPVALKVHGKNVVGDVALDIGPATLAVERDRLLDLALTSPLADVARDLDAILAAAPHRYARANPGKDEKGLTHFAVRGRLEGDRLVPDVKRTGAAADAPLPPVERRPEKLPKKATTRKPVRRTGTGRPKRR